MARITSVELVKELGAANKQKMTMAQFIAAMGAKGYELPDGSMPETYWKGKYNTFRNEYQAAYKAKKDSEPTVAEQIKAILEKTSLSSREPKKSETDKIQDALNLLNSLE